MKLTNGIVCLLICSTAYLANAETSETTKPADSYIRFNPWSSVWTPILELSEGSIFAQEVSLGHLKEDGSIWEFGLIYGSGEYETLSFSSSTEENRNINESTTKGLTLTYLHPVKENGPVKLSMGPRFAYSEESNTLTNKYSGESIESIEYISTQKQRHGMLGLIFQADYAIDSQLSFGIRYSLNYRRTLKTYSTESSLSGTFGEGDAADTLVYTAFDGAHIIFRF